MRRDESVCRSIEPARAHQLGRIHENERKYDAIDPDGTDVWPALRRWRQNRAQYAVHFGFHLVDKPMYDCRRKADENPHRDDEVRPRGTVQLLRERPGDSVTVERLHGLPAPDIVTGRVQQQVTLSPGNGNHNHYERFVNSDHRS